MIAVVAGTPHYLLMEGRSRIGPNVVALLAGIECAPIYGFSDKRAYDNFRANSPLTLTPFPLVKGYLQGLAEMRGEAPKLVVVDPEGPREPLCYAATFEAVLEGLEHQATHVTMTHQLTFDQEAGAYRVEEMSA